jgi:hypothetical protein
LELSRRHYLSYFGMLTRKRWMPAVIIDIL